MCFITKYAHTYKDFFMVQEKDTNRKTQNINIKYKQSKEHK